MVTALRRAVITIVVWLGLSGAIVAALLWDRVTEQRISSERLNHFGDIVADRIWFRSSAELIAHRLHEGEMRVYLIPVPLGKSSPQVRSFSVDASRKSAASVDSDGLRTVWVSGGKIRVANFLGSFGNLSADLVGSGHVVATADGDLAVVVSDAGEMKVFNTSKLQLEREQTISVQGADIIQTTGSFVAVGNLATGDVGVYDLRSPRLAMVEYRRFAKRLLAINVSSTGRLTAATDRGTLLGSSTFAAPGSVRAIDAFDYDSLLVVGDFPGSHLVEPAGSPKELVRSTSGAVAVASNGGHIAVATPRGLEVHTYHYGIAMSQRGHDLLIGWLTFTFILMAASLTKLIRHLWHRFQSLLLALLFPGRPAIREPAPEKGYADLQEAPSDLLKAVAESECLLVAGEALSKPSGIPLWRSFVSALLEWAADRRYIDADEAEQSREAHRIGQFDRVAIAITKRLADQPELIVQYARSLYLKPAALSNVHEALSNVAFAGAITPNLDTLLERSLAMRQDDVFLPTEIVDISGRVSQKRRFMLKIRGHWEKGDAITLVPSQAFRECTSTDEYEQLITFLLSSRTILFLGMSVDDIRTLIQPANLEKVPDRKHYAILPRSETPKRIDTVFRRSNVRVFVHADGDTQNICDFLQKMAAERARASATVTGAERA